MTTANDVSIPEIGRMIKQRRILMSLTAGELAERSGVSSSHLSRIERGERFPSARILRKIAGALDLSENELFVVAGYLNTNSAVASDNSQLIKNLDPYTARILSQEPAETQRTVIGILAILKSLAQVITINQ